MADITTTKHLFDAIKRMRNPSDESNVGRSLRYVIYARKSTDNSDKQTRSPGDQMSECLEFVEKHNLLLGQPTHVQETISAKVSDKRPGFRTTIKAIKKGQ